MTNYCVIYCIIHQQTQHRSKQIYCTMHLQHNEAIVSSWRSIPMRWFCCLLGWWGSIVSASTGGPGKNVTIHWLTLHMPSVTSWTPLRQKKSLLVMISVWSCYLNVCKVVQLAAVVFVWCASTVSSVHWCQCSCAQASCCWWPLGARPVPHPPPRDWARPCYCRESSAPFSDLQSRWKQKENIQWKCQLVSARIFVEHFTG